MAVRPIDINLNIQHASEMARAGSNENLNARPESAAQMFADRMENQRRRQGQQVADSGQSEKSDVQPDRRGYGGGYTPTRKPKKTGNKAQPVSQQGAGGNESMYDIRI